MKKLSVILLFCVSPFLKASCFDLLANGFNSDFAASTNFWSHDTRTAMALQARSHQLKRNDFDDGLRALELNHLRAMRGMDRHPTPLPHSRITPTYNMYRLDGAFEVMFFTRPGSADLPKTIQISSNAARATFVLRGKNPRECMALFAQLLESAYGHSLETSTHPAAIRRHEIQVDKWLRARTLVSSSRPMYVASFHNMGDSHPEGDFELTIDAEVTRESDELVDGLIWAHHLRLP